MVSGQAPERGHPVGLQRREQRPRHQRRPSSPGSSGKRNFGRVDTPANASQPAAPTPPNGQNGCTYPNDVPTLFNQLDAAGKTWKGYAQDLGEPARAVEDARPAAAPARAANNPTNNPTTNPSDADQPCPPGVTLAAPGRSRTTSTSPSTSRSPGSSRSPARRQRPGRALNQPSNGGTDCDANHIANLDNPSTGLVHDLQKQPTDPGLQLDHPEQLQRRARRRLQGQQPLRARSTPTARPTTPRRPRPRLDHAEELHRRPVRLRPVPAVLHPADRAVRSVQARRPDRHHLRRGLPGLHLHRQQLQQRERLPARRSATSRPTPARSSPTARARTSTAGTSLRADRPELDARHRLEGQPALPRPRQQRLHRPAAGRVPRRPDARSRELRARASCAAARAPAARPDRPVTGEHRGFVQTSRSRDNTIAGRRHRPTPRAPAAPAPSPRLLRRHGQRHRARLPATTTSSPVTTGSFQLVGQRRQPGHPDRRRQQLTLSAEGDPGPGPRPDPRPAVQRHPPDPRRRRHRKRPDQPVHQAGHVTATYYNHYSWLRTMEDIFNVGPATTTGRSPAERSRAASTARATSASPPSPGCGPSAGMCSTTRADTARGGSNLDAVDHPERDRLGFALGGTRWPWWVRCWP